MNETLKSRKYLALFKKDTRSVSQALQLFQQNLPVVEPDRKRVSLATETTGGQVNIAQSDADKVLKKASASN